MYIYLMYKHIINTTDRQHRQTLIQHMIQINSTITYKHINTIFSSTKINFMLWKMNILLQDILE